MPLHAPTLAGAVAPTDGRRDVPAPRQSQHDVMERGAAGGVNAEARTHHGLHASRARGRQARVQGLAAAGGRGLQLR